MAAGGDDRRRDDSEARTRAEMAADSPDGRPPRHGSSRVTMLVFGSIVGLVLVACVVGLLVSATRMLSVLVLLVLLVVLILRWPFILAGVLRARDEARARERARKEAGSR